MTIINGLSDSPSQTASLALPDGTRVQLVLTYVPQQLGWFYDWSYVNAAGTSYTYQGNRLTAFPNLMRQQRNLVPFGIMCLTSDNSEPMGQEDFINGNVTLYLLNQTDVANIEAQIFANPG